MAFLLSLALFLFWSWLGYSLLASIMPDRRDLVGALLAPAVGIAVNLLPVFWLSRAGYPAGDFAVLLLIVLAAGTAAAQRSAPARPWRELAPYLALIAAAAVLTGWPLLIHGFEWISYGSDDMVNYALLSDRLLRHGLFEVPTVESIVSGRDFSQTFWVQGLYERAGAELMLAWISGVTGVGTMRLFMPVIIAYQLVLISSTAALVHGAFGRKDVTLTTGVMLALSPLVSLGSLYQSMGQVAGLALLHASLAFSSSLAGESSRRERIGSILVTALLLSGLLALYPEVLPFYLAIVAAFFVVNVFKGSCAWKPFLAVHGAATILVILFLGKYLFCLFGFALMQAERIETARDVATALFPHFLVPSGLSALWGFQAIAWQPPEPFLSAGIVVAVILLAFMVFSSLKTAMNGNAVSWGILVMLSVAFLLFGMKSGYGTFKIAMYMQPLLWSGFAAACLGSGFGPRRLFRYAPLLLLALLAARTQWQYVVVSIGDPGPVGGAFVEIHCATSTRINRELESKVEPFRTRRLVLDTSNNVLAKMQAYILRDFTTAFPFSDLYGMVRKTLPLRQAPELESAQGLLGEARRAITRSAGFLLDPARPSSETNAILLEMGSQPVPSDSGLYAMVVNTALQSLMNRRRFPDTTSNYRVLPWNEVRDHLVFISSERGRLYSAHDLGRIALFQLEPDYFYPGRTMAGLGRDFVFQVVNPTNRPRLVVELTASLKGDGVNALPPVVAIGRERAPLAACGRGSARLFSEPLEPQVIEGRSFVGLAMNAEARFFPNHRTGLADLYGADLSEDPRQLTCFGRGISLVSSEEYAGLRAPAGIASFPADLANPDLEYSGVYEDGWISEESFFMLSGSGDSRILEVRGEVPLLDDPSFRTVCRISVDGRTLASRPLAPGPFEFQLPVSPGAERRRVGLSFDRWRNLPRGDQRPVAARLVSLVIRD